VVGCYEHGSELSRFITGLAKELLAAQEEFLCICLVILVHVNSLANLHVIVILWVYIFVITQHLLDGQGFHVMEATRTHSFRHTTLCRAALDEWSARCRALYLTQVYIHQRSTKFIWIQYSSMRTYFDFAWSPILWSLFILWVLVEQLGALKNEWSLACLVRSVNFEIWHPGILPSNPVGSGSSPLSFKLDCNVGGKT